MRRINDLSEIVGEFLFFDDEKAISISLDQPEIVEALHKQLILGRVVPTISESSS